MDFSAIHNYYEVMIINYVRNELMPRFPDESEDFFLDTICVALNRLPARYMRHEVDMAFYMDQHERQRITQEVKNSVEEAAAYIYGHLKKEKEEAS